MFELISADPIVAEGSRANAESVNLRFGQLYHKALESYDQYRASGRGHDEALDLMVLATLAATWTPATSSPWHPDHPTKTRDKLIRSIIWYCGTFQEDAAQTVIFQTRKPAVE